MNRQARIENALKPCPNPLRTGWFLGLLWGFQWADDYWARKTKRGVAGMWFVIETEWVEDMWTLNIVIWRLTLKVGGHSK